MNEHSEKPPVIKIKKYANRRLYNTKTSSYVTLEDLATMVKKDQDFIVVDAKTNEDITQPVLTQIILEEESKGQSLLPANFLRQLIQMYGHTLEGFVPSYLEQSIGLLVNQQENIYKSFGKNPTFSNLGTLAQNNMEIFQTAMEMFLPFKTNTSTSDKSSTTPHPSSSTSSSGADINIDQIQVQLAKLQQQLDTLAKNKSD